MMIMSRIVTTVEYKYIIDMAQQLGLRERLELLQELLIMISSDITETESKCSIFELKGVGAEMWRETAWMSTFERNAPRGMGRWLQGSNHCS